MSVLKVKNYSIPLLLPHAEYIFDHNFPKIALNPLEFWLKDLPKMEKIWLQKWERSEALVGLIPEKD